MSFDIFATIAKGDLATLKTACEQSFCYLQLLNEKKQTPLLVAILLAKAQIVDYLLLQNAPIDEQGSSLLMHVMIDGELALAAALLKKGVSLNYQNSLGQSALMVACQMGRLEMVELLVKEQADVSLKDSEGLTALEHAQKENELDIVEYLSSLTQKNS